MPTIRRGEALWINVARAVNWLQPTDILPRLVFPGGASGELQTRVRQDLESTLAFFRTQYGIQAEPDFTVYVPENVDALIAALEADGAAYSVAWVRAHYTHVAEGWGGAGSIMLSQRWWIENETIARYTLTHEYAHTLQQQMANSAAPAWLVEGTAEWATGEHHALDQKQHLDALRDYRGLRTTSETPTLRQTERVNAQWQYVLGWLATDRLVAQQGTDSWLEFWRRLTPTEIGPHGRWTSTPDWRTALQQVSGQAASEFYADFDAWQREQAATNASNTSTYSYEYDGNRIHGKVTDEGGQPVAGVFVNAIRVEGETSAGRNQRAETGADGEFAVPAPEDGDYRLSVDINDDCTRHYRNGALVEKEGDASLINVAGVNVASIDIRLLPNVCGEWQIRGRIVGPSAEPLAGIPVFACPAEDGQCHSIISAGDGSFVVAVAEPGTYQLRLDLSDGCYLRVGTPATKSNSASPITVGDADVRGVLVQVPEDMCALSISGRFVDSKGTPLSERVFSAIRRSSGHRSDGSTDLSGDFSDGSTDLHGNFKIRVSSDGAYSFGVKLRSQPHCSHFLAGQALGSPNNPIRVSGADVTNLTLRLPDTIEELCK